MYRRRAVVLSSVLGCALLGACASSETMSRASTQVKDGFGNAVQAPLEDLNIKRVEIPVALIRAQDNPYDLSRMTHCEAIAGEVGSLDDALGPDLDEPPPPPNSQGERGADFAARQTLNAVRDASSSLIPFRGWVRRLSGAERHNMAVQAAIRAGTSRRSYLKGIGMRMNCAPPAAPSWFVPGDEEPAPPPRPKRRRHG